MIGGRYFKGRVMRQEELETMLRIISEVNIEAIIEEGQIVIQAEGEDSTIHSIACCDLRRLAAFSADVTEQLDGDGGVFALAGLFSKCAQIVLNKSEPYYQQKEKSQRFGETVRLFAGNVMENLDEDEGEDKVEDEDE